MQIVVRQDTNIGHFSNLVDVFLFANLMFVFFTFTVPNNF